MTRVDYVKESELKGSMRAAYEEWLGKGKLSNMKKVLLQDEATYEAFMGWYKSWARLVEIVGQRAATIFAHAVSTTNGCLLCSLFFISDLRAMGEDPHSFAMDEKETLLKELAEQMVKNPTAVPDRLFDALRKHYSDRELVAIVGFAAQMMATNNFNSVLRIDVDERLLPLEGDFRPADWRK